MFTFVKKYFSPFANQNEKLCLLEILKPLYILLSALGLFPNAVDFPDGKGNTKIVIKDNSIINLACTLFMIVLIHGFFVLHLVELNVASQDNSMTEGTMTIINYISDLVIQVLFCTVSYFRVIRDRNVYITMWNDMAECWDRLDKGKKGRILSRLRVQVNCGVLGTLLLISLVLMAVTYSGSTTVWKMILIAVTFVLTEIIQFTMVAFYFIMILVLVALLNNIEERFKVYLRTRNGVQNDKKLDLGVDMAEIRDVYVKTLTLKRQINTAFQAPIMVALMVSFHELVSMPHMVYHGLAFQSNFTTHDVVECSLWLLNQLVKMYALAQSGTLLKSQVNKIGRTIHQIPINGDQDLKVYLEVQHFSTMILSFEDSEISVYGYFPLDATLMFNIVASATMYLVILIQLDKPDI